MKAQRPYASRNVYIASFPSACVEELSDIRPLLLTKLFFNIDQHNGLEAVTNLWFCQSQQRQRNKKHQKMIQG
jgi:hypothetical protein